MIEIGITKKQHYVSQGILKHFADQQKKIYELFIDKSIVTKKSIVDTMSQNYVYEHSKIEKNSIEDLFAKFESKAFPLIDSLITEIEEYCRDGDNIIPFKDKIGRNDKCVCGSGKKYKKCCISKYEKAARILQDIYNQKNVDYTIPGARVVEDSILEYEGPQEKLKNKHDKDIIEKIIELSEKEEIRKKP